MAIVYFVTGEYEVDSEVKNYILGSLDENYKDITTPQDVKDSQVVYFVDVPGVPSNKILDVAVIPGFDPAPSGYTPFKSALRGWQGYYQ